MGTRATGSPAKSYNAAPSSPRTPSSIRPVILASFIGTTIEWYDFFLYGTAAALVFNKLFFPTLSPLAGTLSAYGTFAVGFVARPLGGALFGHYGDRVGRKAMLVWSLLIMGVATALMGVLPGYDRLGIWAPLLLVSLRFLQGIGIGGEWGGAVLMAVEHSAGGKRGLHGSWPQMGVPAGLLLSTGVFALVSGTLPESAFFSWGWRLPFLLSVILILVGLFIRLRLPETPQFDRIRQEGVSRAPLFDVIRDHPREILVGMAMRFGQNVLFYIFTVFVLGYGERTLGYSRSTMLAGLATAAVVGMFSIPLFGALSDRIGRRPVYMFGALFSAACAVPFFLMVGTKDPTMIALAFIIEMGIGSGAMFGPQAVYFAELFGPRLRYSGFAFARELGSIIAGGPAPLIAATLVSWMHGAPWGVCVYVIAISLVTAFAVWCGPETYKNDIHEDDVQDRVTA